MIDLAPHYLETVRSILAEHVPNCEVRAFGSRVKWEGWEYSDLDLAVLCGDGEDRRVIARLKEAFENSDLPIRVDVLDWHAVADDFRKVIESDCFVVQAATGFEDSRGAIGADSVESQQPIGALGFQTIRLDGIATIVMGQSPPGSTYNEAGDGLPFYQGATDFGNRYPARRVYCNAPTRTALLGDVLITVRAPIGRVNRATEHCAIGRGIAMVRAETKADTDYLEYVLRDLHEHWHALEADGTVFGNARKSDLVSLEIPWPAEEERRAIAGVLGAFDDKIELNRRMSETLEEMARALFRSWFVDFDPVRAKAEGRPSGLPPDLDVLFPSSFEESELGEIPAGWQVQSLDDIADFTNGLALQRFPPDGSDHLPVIKIAEMRRGYSDRTTRASASIDPRYIVADGDMLFSWSGTLEVVLWSHGPGALNQHLFKVTSDRFPKWFYWGWTLEHLDDFRRIAAGKATTMGHIQRHHLTDARVVAPPVEVVRVAGGPLATLIERQVGLALQSRRLATQRDALLPRLLSGKLRVDGVRESIRTLA